VPVCWAFAPRGFSVSGGELLIERPIGPLRVRIAAIRRLEVMGAGALSGAVRTFGVSGAFGYYGRYRSRALGPFRLYSRRARGPFLLVDSEGGRYLLAPDSPQRMAEALRARSPRALPGLEGGPPTQATARRSRLPSYAALAAVIAVPAIVGAVFLALYARQPVGATVTTGEIRIERKQIAPEVIPLAAVREAELLDPRALHGMRRVAGTALGNAAWGHFRSDALGDFQLWAWQRRGYVLLETTSGRVVLTPDDPARFVEQVRAGLPQRP
jgi:hypothetical protein